MDSERRCESLARDSDLHIARKFQVRSDELNLSSERETPGCGSWRTAAPPPLAVGTADIGFARYVIWPARWRSSVLSSVIIMASVGQACAPGRWEAGR